MRRGWCSQTRSQGRAKPATLEAVPGPSTSWCSCMLQLQKISTSRSRYIKLAPFLTFLFHPWVSSGFVCFYSSRQMLGKQELLKLWLENECWRGSHGTLWWEATARGSQGTERSLAPAHLARGPQSSLFLPLHLPFLGVSYPRKAAWSLLSFIIPLKFR